MADEDEAERSRQLVAGSMRRPPKLKRKSLLLARPGQSGAEYNVQEESVTHPPLAASQSLYQVDAPVALRDPPPPPRDHYRSATMRPGAIPAPLLKSRSLSMSEDPSNTKTIKTSWLDPADDAHGQLLVVHILVTLRKGKEWLQLLNRIVSGEYPIEVTAFRIGDSPLPLSQQWPWHETLDQEYPISDYHFVLQHRGQCKAYCTKILVRLLSWIRTLVIALDNAQGDAVLQAAATLALSVVSMPSAEGDPDSSLQQLQKLIVQLLDQVKIMVTTYLCRRMQLQKQSARQPSGTWTPQQMLYVQAFDELYSIIYETSVSDVLQQGNLQKRSSAEGAFIKSWKKRFFVLQHQQLLYYEREGDTKPSRVIQILPSTILFEETQDKKYAFKLSFTSESTESVQLFLAASNESEFQVWRHSFLFLRELSKWTPVAPRIQSTSQQMGVTAETMKWPNVPSLDLQELKRDMNQHFQKDLARIRNRYEPLLKMAKEAHSLGKSPDSQVIETLVQIYGDRMGPLSSRLVQSTNTLTTNHPVSNDATGFTSFSNRFFKPESLSSLLATAKSDMNGFLGSYGGFDSGLLSMPVP